jgi:hypothetical protein
VIQERVTDHMMQRLSWEKLEKLSGEATKCVSVRHTLISLVVHQFRQRQRACTYMLKLGMPLQYLIACMDCMAIFNVVRRLLVDDQGGSRGMYEVLKTMRGGFK